MFNQFSSDNALCAGLIGYRSLKIAGEAKRLGIYGFGAAAHIVSRANEALDKLRRGDVQGALVLDPQAAE